VEVWRPVPLEFGQPVQANEAHTAKAMEERRAHLKEQPRRDSQIAPERQTDRKRLTIREAKRIDRHQEVGVATRRPG
jgi:hypothetical protein